MPEDEESLDDQEDLDDQVGNMLSQRFGNKDTTEEDVSESATSQEESADDGDDDGEKDAVLEEQQSREPSSTEDAKPPIPDEVDDDGPVRERNQYGMLLPGYQTEWLNEWYRRINALRALEGKEEIDKNSGFNSAIISFVQEEMTDEDLERYLDENERRNS